MNFFFDIVNDSFGYTDLDNSFIVFKSINNIIYVIYSTINKSIICYDLNKQKIAKKIKIHIINILQILDVLMITLINWI